MLQFGLPDLNDNVLEEQIEWNSISNQDRQRYCSIVKTRLNWKQGFPTNKIIFIHRDT